MKPFLLAFIATLLPLGAQTIESENHSTTGYVRRSRKTEPVCKLWN
jgi:hypothetical protein